jgi:hypothetical protein
MVTGLGRHRLVGRLDDLPAAMKKELDSPNKGKVRHVIGLGKRVSGFKRDSHDVAAFAQNLVEHLRAEGD